MDLWWDYWLFVYPVVCVSMLMSVVFKKEFCAFQFCVGGIKCVCVFIQIYIFVFVFCGCVTRLISHDRGIIVIWQYYIYTVTHSVCIYIYCVCVCVSILCMYYIMRTVCVDHVKAWKQTSEKSFVLTLPTDEVLCVCVTLFPQYVPQNLYPVYKNKVVPVADIITPNQFEAE